MAVIKAGIIKRIHVNQHNIRKNTKELTDFPVITLKTSSENIKTNRCRILGEAEVIYSPNKPLACGAKVWIETAAEVEYDETI